MYEIVAGIDENETRARSQANAIVDMPLDREAVHVTLLHDFTDNPEGASVHQVASAREARDVLEADGVDVTLDESSGDPAQAIVDRADGVDADLIVVAGRRQTPTGKVLFGSVTQGVILSTDRPVLVTGGGDGT